MGGKIVSKSIQNQPEIVPNQSKICQKSTPNRSKIAPWRGTQFFIVFNHILDPLLDPFWPNIRPRNYLKNMFKITCKIVSKKVRIWTFWGPFLVSILHLNSHIFRTFFRHRFWTYVLHVFLIFSNRWNLKKHCISAVKHVFPQVQPFHE